MVDGAPPFEFDPPAGEVVDELALGYQELTHQAIRTQKQRNLLATCYRVHGPDFLVVASRLFDELGTTQNLLGMIRAARRSSVHVQSLSDRILPAEATSDRAGGGCPVASCVRTLVPCSLHAPHDGKSKFRYDRPAHAPNGLPLMPGRQR
jgi:hypothetical protein